MIEPPEEEPRERGPFDEILEPEGEGQDRSASIIFIGMGAIGLILLLVVLNPFSLFGGGAAYGAKRYAFHGSPLCKVRQRFAFLHGNL